MACSLDLIAKFHLTEEDVNKQITDRHIEDISCTLCGKWRSLPAHLRLAIITVGDINRGSGDEREKRRIFLTTWKEQKGSNATYIRLINALLKIKCAEDAESVCKLLEDDQQPESDVSLSNVSTCSGIIYL